MILDYALLLILMLTSFFVIWYNNWKRDLVGLAIISVIVSGNLLLINQAIGAAVILAGSLLGIALMYWIASRVNTPIGTDYDSFGMKFQLLIGFAFVGLDYALAIGLAKSLNADVPFILSALVLMSNGILEFAMSNRSATIIIGLFMLLAGFSMLYLTLNFSLMVSALLAALLFGLGAIGAYWFSQNRELAN